MSSRLAWSLNALNHLKEGEGLLLQGFDKVGNGSPGIDREQVKLVQCLPRFIKSDDCSDLVAAITTIQDTVPPFTPPAKWKHFDPSPENVMNQNPLPQAITDTTTMVYMMKLDIIWSLL